jgi:hypothetical protein
MPSMNHSHADRAATVVNIKRSKRYDVYIGRGSMWGNPYSHRPSTYRDVILVATRDEAIRRYRIWLWQQVREHRITIEQLAALHGKRLGCFCEPQRCHGEVLAMAAAWAHAQLATRATRS